MFSFASPWMALVLLAPLALRLFAPLREAERRDQRERRVSLLHPALEKLSVAFDGLKPRPSLGSRLYSLLLWLMWILLALTLMRPQWLNPYTEARAEGRDLMLAVDTSHSMEALDFTVEGREVSRMQVVKGVMARFIEARENDRIGLIVFGSQSFVLSPLTLDRASVGDLLRDLVPGIAGDGTAMGDALGLGVKKLRERPEGSRVLVLVADGENTAGTIPPLEAARLAQREGVRIYTIGVGSDRKEVPILEGGRVITRTDLGFDEEVLKNIAHAAGGDYFRATDAKALEGISQRIDELERTRAESRTVYIPQPLYRWPLGSALVVLLVLGLFPRLRPRQWGKA